jgi:ABC-type polar amino acid transport system ATPase subunit
MIELKNITKKIDNKIIVNDFSVALNSGEIIGITGDSGSGKTSLCRIIAGIDCFDSGEIILNANEFTSRNYKDIRGKVGFVFQGYDLFYNLNVLENITYAPIKVLGQNKEVVNQRAEEMLKMFGVESCRNLKQNSLSGGQRQRVCIIRSLITNPEVIIFDEPTSALDRKSVDNFLDIMRKIINKNRTIIIISHDKYVIENLSTRVIKIKNGSLV